MDCASYDATAKTNLQASTLFESPGLWPWGRRRAAIERAHFRMLAYPISMKRPYVLVDLRTATTHKHGLLHLTVLMFVYQPSLSYSDSSTLNDAHSPNRKALCSLLQTLAVGLVTCRLYFHEPQVPQPGCQKQAA